MKQFYSDPAMASDPYLLPNCRVFYRTKEENKEYGFLDGSNDPMPSGFYYDFCFPGCLPEGEPFGPFLTEKDAIEHCRKEWE